MKTFNCKIELAGQLGASSINFEADVIMRAAIEWLMLGAQRDRASQAAKPCVTFEHLPGSLVIRIDKHAAAEVAVARRIN